MSTRLRLETMSDVSQEILSARPHFMIRWGMTILLFVVAAIACPAWLIRYPDVIEGEIQLATFSEPKTVHAPMDGCIRTLSVREGDRVSADQEMAVIEDVTHLDDVASVESAVLGMEQMEGTLNVRETLVLGGIKNDYAAFLESLNTFRSQIALGHYQREKNLVSSQSAYLEELSGKLALSRKITEEKYALFQKEEEAYTRLFAQGLVSEGDLVVRQSRLSDVKNELVQIDQSMIRNEMEKRNFEDKLVGLERKRQELEGAVSQARGALLAAITEWRRKHVIRAPASGLVSLGKACSENNQIRSGDELMTIVPDGGSVKGKALLSQDNFGKITPGKLVTVDFLAYPAEQYGLVQGVVAGIPSMSRDKTFTIAVEFPDGLRTSMGKELPFRQGLVGRARILTREYRLIERVLSPLALIYQQNVGAP